MKDKRASLTDMSNYRAITISSALSKLFEGTIADCLHTKSEVDDFQFGFKAKHYQSLY